MKPGGVVVWVVGDKTHNGNKSLTSFKHAIYFQEIGFNVHDVMIYQKQNPVPVNRGNAYQGCFEYMFIFTKGKPNTFNCIREKAVRSNHINNFTQRNRDGVLSEGKHIIIHETKPRHNIWSYGVGLGGTTSDKFAFKHPAMFPEQLAHDHIISWSNPGDIVFDPMCGAGTTLKMAALLGRRFIGCDISQEYVNIAQERIQQVKGQSTLSSISPEVTG